jgi:Na+/proline symporter
MGYKDKHIPSLANQSILSLSMIILSGIGTGPVSIGSVFFSRTTGRKWFPVFLLGMANQTGLMLELAGGFLSTMKGETDLGRNHGRGR